MEGRERQASLRAMISGESEVGHIGSGVVLIGKLNGFITSHVLFALENDESISAVGLLLLVTLFMGMGIFDNADLEDLSATVGSAQNGQDQKTYALNWTDATKFFLQIFLCGIVAEAGNDHGLECIAANVLIFLWLVCAKNISCAHVKQSNGRGYSQSKGPSVNSFSISAFFSSFFRSRASSQLSVGTNPSASLYAARAGRNSATPPTAVVFRSSAGRSQGATHLKGGRGAKSASRFGGSLSVILRCRSYQRRSNDGKLYVAGEMKRDSAWYRFSPNDAKVR